MEARGGWHPIGGKGHNAAKDYDGDRESENRLDRDRVAVAVFLLVIIGIAIYSLVSNPGVRELAKSLVTGVWEMLYSIGHACSDFVKYVQHQRTS